MINNKWNKEAIIRAFNRGLGFQEIENHFSDHGFTIDDIKTVVVEKYPMMEA